MNSSPHRLITHWPFSLLIMVLGVFVLAGCGAAPAPTATPVPPTATAAPTEEAAPASDEILLVTGEFPPLTSESLEGGGLSTEIVTAVFAQMGRPVRVEYYPWERAEAMVASGEAWGAFPYVPTEERKAKFFVTEPISYGRTVWFYYGDKMADTQFETLADLKPYRVGISLGYWYIPMLQEAGLTLDEGNDDVANLRKLKAGRIDLFPIYEPIGRWQLRSNFADDLDAFQTLGTPLDISPDTVIVARDYPNSDAILQEFNAALATFMDSDAYREIFAKYGLEPATIEELAALD